MLDFSVIDLCDSTFRCVLGECSYFDFSINKSELFNYSTLCKVLKRNINKSVRDIFTDNVIGDVASVRFNKESNTIWILTREGIFGQFFIKELRL